MLCRRWDSNPHSPERTGLTVRRPYWGRDDRVVPADVQREMAALIPQSQLILYPGYGHVNDQESPDYARQVNLFVGTL